MRVRSLSAAIGMAILAGPLAAQQQVTPETFIRAETDRTFHRFVQNAGGAINTFFYIRSPTPLDAQDVVRMNRDTLYAAAVVDTEGGASVTIPELPDARYASILVIDNDHYAPAVFYDSGAHPLPTDTKYVALLMRIQLFDPNDPDEVALVNDLQDRFVVEAASADPLPPFAWDTESLDALRARYEADSAAYPSWKGMQGPRGQVDEATRHIAAAAAWGLFPEWDATYLNYSGDHDARVCYAATYEVPENEGFWSITVYGADGFMKSENSSLNAGNAELNPDGTFTARFGTAASCGEKANRLDVTDGWNFLMRVYRPGASVLDGSYRLPEATPAG